MIEKNDCTIGTEIIVNTKVTKWNTELGMKNNGLLAFKYNKSGYSIGDATLEIPVNTVLVILDKPKRISESGVMLKYKIKDTDIYLMSYWIVIKHKVDLI
jgi:hypothetical protein